jgi:hypothetical protein
MKWTVVWKQVPEDKLASLWTEAAPEDRQAISAAADTIDRELRTDPRSLGESRSGNERTFICSPLAVLFEVHPQDYRVVVFKVWRV